MTRLGLFVALFTVLLTNTPTVEAKEGPIYALGGEVYCTGNECGVGLAFERLHRGLEVDVFLKAGVYDPIGHPDQLWPTNGLGVRLLWVVGEGSFRFLYGGFVAASVNQDFKTVDIQPQLGMVYRLGDDKERLQARFKILGGGGMTVGFERWNDDDTQVIGEWNVVATVSIPFSAGP
jgi:hypothetical protein